MKPAMRKSGDATDNVSHNTGMKRMSMDNTRILMVTDCNPQSQLFIDYIRQRAYRQVAPLQYLPQDQGSQSHSGHELGASESRCTAHGLAAQPPQGAHVMTPAVPTKKAPLPKEQRNVTRFTSPTRHAAT